MIDAVLDPIDGILAVLDEGSATGANKFGLLLALIDLAPAVDDDRLLPVESIVAQLIDIHWDHARPFRSSGPLRQISSGNRQNTTVLLAVQELQEHVDAGLPFELARPLIPDVAWKAALRRVTRDLRRAPLKLLQNLPGDPPPFLYDILDCRPPAIRFVPGGLEDLVRFGPVLRTMVESRFVRFVAAINRASLGPSVLDDLDEHLFGLQRRMPPRGMRREMWELQEARCVFTELCIPDPSLSKGQVAIDHVIPWARNRLSAVENFVVIDRSTNSSKRNFLLAPLTLKRWVDHLDKNGPQLAAIATRHGWPSDPSRVATVARALYQSTGNASPVWTGAGVELLDADGRNDILAALRTLLGS